MRVQIHSLIFIAPVLLLLSASCVSNDNMNQAAATNQSVSTTTTTTTASSSQVSSSPAAPAVSPNGAGNGTNSVQSNSPNASTATGSKTTDPCALLTSDDIKAVQGEGIKETKATQHNEGNFTISQCFYTTATFTQSVSLEVTQRNPNVPGKEGPREFWTEHFRRNAEQDKEHERDKRKSDRDRGEQRGAGEEEEESAPPKRVAGIGEEAYYVGNRINGALYVLKKDSFLRISIGGKDDETSRINKSKLLAQKALMRM